MQDQIALPSQHPVPEGALAIWVVYEHPADFPHGYVLRPQFAMPGGEILASNAAWYAKSADELRSILPGGVTRLRRHPDDMPCIMEVWI